MERGHNKIGAELYFAPVLFLGEKYKGERRWIIFQEQT
jgi:hypothetical protein